MYIHRRDGVCTVLNLLTYRIFTGLPSVFAQGAGTAAALSALFSGLVALVLIFAVAAVLSHLKISNLQSSVHSAAGKPASLPFSVMIIVYLAFSATAALGEFANLAKLISFPVSPLWFVSAFLLAGGICGAAGGGMSVLRLHGFFAPLVAGGLVFLIAATALRGDISNLFPVLGIGTDGVFFSGLRGTFLYSDILLLYLIFPNDSDPRQVRSTVMTGTALAVAVNVLFVLAFTLTVPYPVSAEGQFPVYLLLKEVRIGRFLQRIDAVMQLLSAISCMLYLSLNFSIIAQTLRHIFATSEKRTVNQNEQA